MKKRSLVFLLVTLMLLGSVGSPGVMTVSAAEEIVTPSTAYTMGTPTEVRATNLSIRGGSSVGYEYNFKMSPSSIAVKFGTNTGESGTISLRADSAGGELIGTINTGDYVGTSWTTVEVSVPVMVDLKGKHSIWVCCGKGAHDFYSLRITIPEAKDVYARYSDVDAFADIAESGKRTEINLLADLGILSKNETKFDAKMPISKRELVKALAAFYSDDMALLADTRLFSDMDSSDSDYKSFLKLCTAGVLTKNESMAVKASAMVSLTETCEMTVRMLGYDYLNSAGRDYISIARRLGLLKGVDESNSKALRRGDMASVLYNALSSDYAAIASISHEDVVFSKENSILSRTKSIYMAEGVVTANSNNNLYSASEAAPVGSVIINGAVYDAGDSAAQNYFGVNCTYFYQEESGDRTVVAIRPTKCVELRRFVSGDTEFSAITDRAISYYNDRDKIETAHLTQNTVLVYNGRPASDGLSQLVQPESFQGEMLAFDNDGDGDFDVLIIEQAESVIFGGLSGEAMYDLLNNQTITFRNFDDIRLFIGTSGTTWSNLQVGGVLDVYRSRAADGDELCRIYVATATASGQVVGVEDGGKKVILDDGQTYEAYTVVKKQPSVGQNVMLKLNSIGKFVDYSETGTVQTGVIFKSGNIGSGGLKQQVAAELLTEDSQIETYDFADRVYADGILIKSDELVAGKGGFVGLTKLMQQAATEAAAWVSGTSSSYSLEPFMPVRYSLNKDGEINMIDTPNQGSGGANDTLTALLPGRYATCLSKYGATMQDGSESDICPVSNTAKVASIWQSGDRETYSYQKGLPSNDSWKALVPYTTKEGSMVADFVVWLLRSGGDSLPSVLVDKISTVVDKDGEEVKLFHGYNASGEFQATVSKLMYHQDATFKKTVDSVVPGDLIQVRKDGRGEICFMELRYLHDGADVNAAGITPTLSLNNPTMSQSGSIGRMYSGEIVAIEDDFVKIAKVADGESVTEGATYEYLQITGIKLALCENNGGRLTITPNVGKGYAGVGSRIIVCGVPWYSYVSFGVVYR